MSEALQTEDRKHLNMLREALRKTIDAGSTSNWAAMRKLMSQLTPINRHDLVHDGVSTKLFLGLVGTFDHVSKEELYAVIGISEKTVGRRKLTALPREASDATLALIEITSMAEATLGSHTAAEQWLITPALGLNGRRPIDLLSTRAGAEMVKTLLIRMDYGVFA